MLREPPGRFKAYNLHPCRRIGERDRLDRSSRRLAGWPRTQNDSPFGEPSQCTNAFGEKSEQTRAAPLAVLPKAAGADRRDAGWGRSRIDVFI
jgi:hypothetical protein